MSCGCGINGSKITVTVEDFREAFPEFKNPPVTDEIVTAMIMRSCCFISHNNYGCLSGDCRKYAILLYIAHLVYLNGLISDGTTSGNPVQTTIGSVSVTLQPPPNDSQIEYWLNGTPYGKELWAILGKCGAFVLYYGIRSPRVYR